MAALDRVFRCGKLEDLACSSVSMIGYPSARGVTIAKVNRHWAGPRGFAGPVRKKIVAVRPDKA